MKKKSILLSLRSLTLAACALFWFPALAQVAGPLMPIGPPGQAKFSGKAIRTEALALVNVTATDPYGRLVTGLERENFRVFEDGIEQEIISFSSEDVPVSIGLIFDMSGSMSDKVEKARRAAVQFLQTANPRDEFFLVSFGGADPPLYFQYRRSAERDVIHHRTRPHGTFRCDLPRSEPNEGRTKQQTRLTHHIGWRR
jgi:hypothetical protein